MSKRRLRIHSATRPPSSTTHAGGEDRELDGAEQPSGDEQARRAAPARLQPRRVEDPRPLAHRPQPEAPGTGTEARSAREHVAGVTPRSSASGASSSAVLEHDRREPLHVVGHHVVAPEARRERAGGPLERERAARADAEREVAVVAGRVDEVDDVRPEVGGDVHRRDRVGRRR